MGHKTLHESAAEILAASVANAGKEPLPMAAVMNPPADLGGEMPTGEVSAIGANSAEQVPESPKPGRPGAPAEEIKTMAPEAEATEESEEDSEEEKEEMNEELVVLSEEQMLLYEEAVDAEVDVLLENIVTEFGEVEYSDEDFQSLQEQSNAFIAEMEALSEEEFDQYLATLTEEEFIYAVQLASLNEGFFKKIGKALKKGVKSVAKVVAKVAPIASFIPGVGTALGAIGSAIGGKLAGTAVGKLASSAVGKLASSAVGKGVAALGKTAVGGALKSAATNALTSGIGSKLQGGSFSQGAKAGAIGSIAGSAAGALGGKLGLNKLADTGAAGALKGAVGDALTTGIGSKLSGGSFSQGAKAGAIGSAVGSLASGVGKGLMGATGSQTAGDIGSQAVQAAADRAAAKKAAQKADQDYEAEEPETTEAEEPETSTAPQTKVATVSKPAPARAPEPEEDDDADTVGGFMKGIRKGRGGRMVAEDANELLEHLSTLNEEELNQFIDQLSDEDAELMADVLEENVLALAARGAGALVKGAKAAASGAKAAASKMKDSFTKKPKISAAEKAKATDAVIDTGKSIVKTTTKTSALKTAARVAGKAAVPVTAAMAGYDAYKGYTADPTASLAQKVKNAGSSALSGATFGLLGTDAEKLKAQPKPAAVAATKTTKPTNIRGVRSRIEADKKKDAAKAELDAKVADMQRKKDAAMVKIDKEGLKAGDGTQLIAPKSVAPSAPTTGSVASVTPPAAAPVARPSSAGDNDWDYASTWAANPIARGSRADSAEYDDREEMEDMPSEKPKKTGIGVFRTPTGEKTALRKAIPNELVAMKDVVGNALKIKELGWKPGTNRLGYPTGMNEQVEESHMNGEETTMETTELTEEQIREERMLAIKEAVKQFKGNMREDVDALFNGESLSEEFRAKATLIFESAVTSRVESILEQVMQQNDEVLAAAYDEIRDGLTEQVDEYLNYVVEQWMEDNKVAVETGLRAELAEDFISGLRALFQEHYIEIPEDKVDVAETLAAELEQAGEYVETVHQHIEEQDAAIKALQEEINAVKKEKAVINFCEGLTAVQAGKMKALAEGVEFTTEGDFEEKLAVLRENYFPSKVQVKSEVKELQQVALNEEPEVAQTNSIMSKYVQAIAKTAPKA